MSSVPPPSGSKGLHPCWPPDPKFGGNKFLQSVGNYLPVFNLQLRHPHCVCNIRCRQGVDPSNFHITDTLPGSPSHGSYLFSVYMLFSIYMSFSICISTCTTVCQIIRSQHLAPHLHKSY